MKLFDLIRGRPAPVRYPEPAGDNGVWAIGDIHGCADLLWALLGYIAESQPGGRPEVVFLGDYVDRGPDSLRVVDMLLEFAGRFPGARFVRGNHDQILLDFLHDETLGPRWCEWGGAATLASYGVSVPRALTDAPAWLETRDAFADRLPDRHLRFFQELVSHVVSGDYYFAHAGVRPGTPLDQQSDSDLMWIRQPFLTSRKRLGKVVVHGHTPAEEPYVDHRRIGLDTSAYATGVLTGVFLNGRDRTLVQARRRADDPGLVEISLEDPGLELL